MWYMNEKSAPAHWQYTEILIHFRWKTDKNTFSPVWKSAFPCEQSTIGSVPTTENREQRSGVIFQILPCWIPWTNTNEVKVSEITEMLLTLNRRQERIWHQCFNVWYTLESDEDEVTCTMNSHLPLMLLVANLAYTKWCKKPEKWLKLWHMGTHLRVLSECYLMNTNMTGLRRFWNFLASLWLGGK